ncbi:type II secretion system F family protein [candidate division TA06 bacterium]|uniref:Type II secretion system F family protein n=1 Tax=candidate division TA06 bacterium TaxID=2250710 RepID=A0A523UMZ9_UNCT6|nr:MAG: type II secretion system F family protein [candidate division TA06 bacterium]
MPIFVWKGRSASGAVQTGELVAESQQEVFAALRAKKIIPTSVRPKPKEIGLPFLKGGRLGTRDLSIFTRQFATMINAGLPLMQCLEIQSQQTDNPGFKKVLRQIMEDVEGGATLAEALRRQKGSFSTLYVNMVEAGETGGALDVILVRLANYLEKAAALARKIKGAMIYPAMIVSVAVVAVGVILIAVIPVFAQLFSEFGAELPLATRIVIGLSDILRRYSWIFLIFAIALIVAVKMTYQRDAGKLAIDKALLRMPVMGDLIRKTAIARFSRTLSTLLASGVPILDALETTAKTAGNKVVENAVRAARSSISEGETIAGPLSKEAVFPPMVVQMISIGEATGGLDDMLSKIADFYDTEVDAAVENLTSALEPIIMVFLGTVIGGIVIAMYLPIFKIATIVGGGH